MYFSPISMISLWQAIPIQLNSGFRIAADVGERTDFLIIGSGIAGLRAAADLARHGSVTILTKADPTESNTGYAQGGIAAAIGADDSPEEHFADTMAAGDGLCEEDAVRVLVDDGVDLCQRADRVGCRVRSRSRRSAGARSRRGASSAPCPPCPRRDRPRDRTPLVVASRRTSPRGAGDHQCACDRIDDGKRAVCWGQLTEMAT